MLSATPSCQSVVFFCCSWKIPIRDSSTQYTRIFKCVIDQSIERFTITHRSHITLFTRRAVISLHFVAGEIGIGCHGNLFLRMISELTSPSLSMSVVFRTVYSLFSLWESLWLFCIFVYHEIPFRWVRIYQSHFPIISVTCKYTWSKSMLHVLRRACQSSIEWLRHPQEEWICVLLWISGIITERERERERERECV